jgi:uncharacterized membrane protein YfcA
MIELGAIVVGIFLGAVVSGFSGFAFSAAAGAVLIHVVEPNETIPLMMACSIISQVITMLTLRRSVRFEVNPIMLSGGVAGVALAVALITKLDAQTLRWLFGSFLAAYATYLLVKAPQIRMSLAGGLSQSVVGTLGGAVGVLTAMPGALPSIWCELRGCTKEQQRGTVQPFIIGMQIVALLLLAITPGGMPAALPYHLLIALPALLLGSWLGTIAFRRIDGLVFRKAILMMLIMSGLAMLH